MKRSSKQLTGEGGRKDFGWVGLGRWWGGAAGMGRGTPEHLPAAMILTDIFPRARCHGRIIAHDYRGDQRDRLSLILQTSVGEVTQAGTKIVPDLQQLLNHAGRGSALPREDKLSPSAVGQ